MSKRQQAFIFSVLVANLLFYILILAGIGRSSKVNWPELGVALCLGTIAWLGLEVLKKK